MNGPMIFLEKGTKVHLRIRGKKLVTRYIFQEGYYVIPNKATYVDDETWDEVVKVVSPGIIKMMVSNVTCVLPILLYIYIYI